MNRDELKALAVNAVEDVKAFDVNVVDVMGRSSVTDVLVFASGRSDRQVKSIANNVVIEAKKAGVAPLGVEGLNTGEWVLVDLGDVVVHVMLPQVRDYYGIERMWDVDGPGYGDDPSYDDGSAFNDGE
ncbi:MAG: ribosome silencing factor [gamma proteobacterium symbiont of Bathyaustriella thionipta]|nr:ribosome silencing factor [gamma proteobacterium symbiont of Bathyaustriella thionipta]MCU7951469.1 ribosome silencing factor [gamma proteobacterium symbiont of Bathyaustriella thionipta]MCU7954894.1 ribosome silencing factor [gamma proteobacterium symbiont of Bathyaustriella thionipta]MCU7958037.1 ribosome silencing factor [gamma proteobacterium symbiont of Bathyaustriella thionipta]MCU7968682.1 ribosome silencing factor [gamma proteobacterium symbiont of Bathyaustriella thionipta]